MELAGGMKCQSRKKHPCGGESWEILRVGADIRVKCLTCGHTVLIPRPKAEKIIKEIIPC